MSDDKRADTFTKFQFQGKVLEHPSAQTSAKGNQYLRLKMECAVGPQKFPRKFLSVAFGALATEIENGCAQGDIIQLSGTIEPQKEQDGSWGNSFIAKAFKLVEQALQNDMAAVKDAFDAQEDDGVPF